MTSAEDLRARKDEGRRWRWADVGEKLEKGGAYLSAHPVTTTWNGSMACFLSYVQCLDDHFVHQRREMVVWSLKCHWNISFPSNIVTKILNWTILIITFSHSWAVINIVSILNNTVLTRNIPLGTFRKLELEMSLGSSASFISMEHSLSSIL